MDERANIQATHTELCVSLCEKAPLEASAQDLETMLAATCERAGFPYCERIYVGSYFCENYFLGLSDAFHESLRELCWRYDMHATLVIPIMGQAFLKRANERIPQLLTDFRSMYDEAIANDAALFGDLARWCANEADSPFGLPAFPSLADNPLRLGLGRLFSKELRDARYEWKTSQVAYPQLSAEAIACLRMQREHLPETQALVEVDPTSTMVDVSGIMETLAAETARDGEGTLAYDKPAVAMHLPYCYATTGRNCSAASIGKPDGEKFRLGKACTHTCLKIAQDNATEEGAHFLKHGRTHYFANPACQIAGTASWRIIYACI